MKLKKQTTADAVKNQFSALINDSLGDLSQIIEEFSTFENANENSMIFVLSPKLFGAALNSKAQTVIAPAKAKDWWTENGGSKTVLLSPNPELAAREVKTHLVFPTPFKAAFQGVHPTAVVAESAELSIGVTVGPHAIIGENCRIGEGSFIGTNAVVEENVTIGNHTTIHPLAYIGHSCQVGNNCEVMPSAIVGSEGYGYAHDHLGNHYRIPHTGKVILEDDVHIGAATAIDRGTMDDTVIGEGTKIDNQCHLAHNVEVGRNGLITAQFVTAGSAKIGNNFICGGKSIVAGHTKVGDNVSLAGLSVITKDWDKPGQFGGYPLQPVKDFLKTKSTMVHLVQMRKQLNQLMKKVFPEGDA
ncbi:MAG: UDP-3-O-(3-hydroxymyristoyl)glucosamine N-acyltransferase [Bdellovibrionales bacterium]|nr:UDP-3-O-(3-hydroxymyristoyl)glucosamine N-acyltransferase [Bdellovibrionales bacterium]